MTTQDLFYANPYDPTKTGFNFTTFESYQAEYDHRHALFGTVEYELQAIDGKQIDLELFAGLHISQANLSGAELSFAELNGANLRQADLSEAEFSAADLTGADLAGAVIRGATAHFDFVAGECARGLMEVSLRHRCAVSFGVLTTDDVEQALERANPDAGNKGFDVAVAALEMADLLRRIREQPDGEQ